MLNINTSVKSSKQSVFWFKKHIQNQELNASLLNLSPEYKKDVFVTFHNNCVRKSLKKKTQILNNWRLKDVY